MNTTRNRRASVIGAIVLAAVVGTTLAGCSAELSREDAEASTHKVIETDRKFWSGESWAYVDGSGKKIPLSKDCQEGFFSELCRSSKNGLIKFQYSSGKYGISSESITVDGVKWEADCTQKPGFSGGDYVCAPLADRRDK